ncbi:MAG: hypothetical protein IEMM0006_2019 [bacterium]|nr:MAG: hypothetical protein IEMM0006_2019 [bacterium]
MDTQLLFLQQHHIFNMMSLRKHIHRLHFCYPVFFVEQGNVACLRSRITADINNFFGRCLQNLFDHFGMHAGTWRVGKQHIGDAVSGNKVFKLPAKLTRTNDMHTVRGRFYQNVQHHQ